MEKREVTQQKDKIKQKKNSQITLGFTLRTGPHKLNTARIAKTNTHKNKVETGGRWGERPTNAISQKPPQGARTLQQRRAPSNLSSGATAPGALPEAGSRGSGSDSSDFRGSGAAGAECSPGNAPFPGRLHLPRPPQLGRTRLGLGWDSRGGQPSALAPPQELHTPGPLSPAPCTWARRDPDANRRTAPETGRILSLGTFFTTAARPPGATAPAHETWKLVPGLNGSAFPYELHFPEVIAGRRSTVPDMGQ